jgi:signal transduction histidine kinase
MHDVLAHRLSLLAVHAGSLQFRPDAAPEQVARAAEVIRDSAHAALEDLRSVIALLRTPTDDDYTRPQPTAADLPDLIAQSRAAGLAISFDLASDLRDLDPQSGRTVYRIVQEALTNVRKHAPYARVQLTIRGGPSAGLHVTVRNDLTGRGTPPLPGSGTGLVGLRERAELAGGQLRHGLTEDGTGFLLDVELPWAMAQRQAAAASGPSR